MELRELRYLVAIAEEGNLGRAAKRLYVSQPTLSYALKSLESKLGVRLFDRHAGGVTATRAGGDVVIAARRAIREAERVTEVADSYRRGGVGPLRVGFEASGAGELIARSRAEFARRNPGVRVEPRRFDWGEEVAALRDGRADVAFVWLPADLTGMCAEVVHVESRVVGFPAAHPLAARERVTLEDVRDEPLTWTEHAPRAWVEWWAVVPRPDGSTPRWGPTNRNVEEMLEQVAAGAAICFAPAGMALYYARPDLAWVPLDGVEPMRVALAWPRDEETDAIREFGRVVRELAAEPPR
ncbi:LysR family transcriptional regulator [Streptomyces hainanensis]|uniref:LysR family transcriptional regulator n=1 Tax=Streptomyces hainanensis TaxID=402648 RepID=A0A4V2Y2M8_9ACTN|nr:LysR family transcriptional regulator [Streptomyces hainanensis]TDC73275.1 LysR family transcriptional regulator [Streptomyces hainanensis]